MKRISTKGLTLVELMVAMALGLIITLAAISALILSQQGFKTVDASSQIKDNARFASEIMRRVILQSGYQSTPFAINRGNELQTSENNSHEPHVKGFDDSGYEETLLEGTSNNSGKNGINNSDLLIIRYQIGLDTANNQADHAMINCSGQISIEDEDTPLHAYERLGSAFYIENSNNEPTLMCAHLTSSGKWVSQPLVSGVESFQVLYGTHNVSANTAPAPTNPSDPTPPADQYLRADELIVNGDDEATTENWSRVGSVRIGMVLRGPVGSAMDKTTSTQLPFGTDTLCTAADKGCSYTAAADGRLRQNLSFTVHLRNIQNL